MCTVDLSHNEKSTNPRQDTHYEKANTIYNYNTISVFSPMSSKVSAVLFAHTALRQCHYVVAFVLLPLKLSEASSKIVYSN